MIYSKEFLSILLKYLFLLFFLTLFRVILKQLKLCKSTETSLIVINNQGEFL